MIYAALKILRDELEAFISLRRQMIDDEKVVLGNISLLDSPDNESIQNSIVVSLVNVEEESALKNFKTYQRVNGDGNVQHVNPDVHLNLYLLFTANFPSANYEKALKRLSNVIQFFQSKKVFTVVNSPHANIDSLDHSPEIGEPDKANIRLILDLYTLTFEQINHLWGALGGKQIPFVMYKCRLVKYSDPGLRGTDPWIEEVNSNDKAI